MSEFRDSAPSAPAVFYRSYSRRKPDGTRESFVDAITRTVNDLAGIGKLTDEQRALCLEMGLKQHAFPSGRALWVAGTDWSKKPENFPGFYNCASNFVDEVSMFGFLMELAMCGTGTGAVLEQDVVDRLPAVETKISIAGHVDNESRKGGQENTELYYDDEAGLFVVTVGDSRRGWVDAYQGLIELAMGLREDLKEECEAQNNDVEILLDLSQVRQAGEPLKGFGGVANPVRLRTTLERVTAILAKAVGRKLTPIECCLLVDEAASAVVAGNIRRCLPGDALVRTENGDVPIKDIEIGTLVYTSSGLKPVVDKFDQGKQDIYEIITLQGNLFCSKEHQVAVLCADGSYMMIKACDLIAGDRMIKAAPDGYVGNPLGCSVVKSVAVEVVAVRLTPRFEDTFDIEVQDIHEFYCDGYLVSNSAGMRQFSEHDEEAASAKLGLYKQDENGNWSVDPEREALRMANHTRTWHHKPSYEEILDAVTKQYYSGEGAIQYVPEAIARANADLLDTEVKKKKFLSLYCKEDKKEATDYIVSLAESKGEPVDEKIIYHRMHRYGLNPCAEILLKDNVCNLSEVHLNTLAFSDIKEQKSAFYAGGLQVAALLQHHFVNKRLQYSRENDPIVAVSFTGLFDFFVHNLGVSWLAWMMKGRPPGKTYKKFTDKERFYLEAWRDAAKQAVVDYCSENGIRIPNRYTAVQPAGSKSLLTGASSGWHPPKAQRFIRRITFGKHDPLVAALRDYGYSVIPAQSARDDDGNLLDDVNDPRVHEVLVEIPTEVSWANLPGADQYDLNMLPIEAQWGLYMQVQRHYATHTTSATLEYREHEIGKLADLIYEDIKNDGGYISVALLARFDANATFPRLPFEPIDKVTYDRLMAQIKAYRVTLPEDVTILDLLKPYDHPDHVLEPQDTACANAACLAKIEQDQAKGLV